MKTIQFTSLALVSLATLFSGCVSPRSAMVLDPVGPPVSMPATYSTDGSLLVFSAYDSGQNGLGDPEQAQRHSDYRLFDPEGKLVETVDNRAGSWGVDPASVALAPGRYRIEARANGYGIVSLPVVIAASQVTTVHLEGSASWPEPKAFNLANSVRLPDGEVVGWKAVAQNAVSPTPPQ
jgi:hypothetical protein